ncbi:hypothetical protein EYF80_048427 [Liparis tanakae]|uniref:Uncharacterized protein n=1 Tax=Liparis tanakae TaxID=230148 RepID=A0A4Z2FKI7_9TELE|nr:hypothetical protein EYF80_048427 [Liparis tanakae]
MIISVPISWNLFHRSDPCRSTRASSALPVPGRPRSLLRGDRHVVMLFILYSRDPSLLHSASLPRSLVHVPSARGPGLPVRSAASARCSSPGAAASSRAVRRLFSAPISASTENACALTLSAHGTRRFSAMAPVPVRRKPRKEVSPGRVEEKSSQAGKPVPRGRSGASSPSGSRDTRHELRGRLRYP